MRYGGAVVAAYQAERGPKGLPCGPAPIALRLIFRALSVSTTASPTSGARVFARWQDLCESPHHRTPAKAGIQSHMRKPLVCLTLDPSPRRDTDFP
jgi:hypothetical protein